MKKLIFGKCYSFSSEPEYWPCLEESLALYTDAGHTLSQVDVHITHEGASDMVVAINPRVHRKLEDGMLTSFPPVDVSWKWGEDGRLKVVAVLKTRDGLKRRVKKVLSMEYSTDVEYFEQVLHEFVLVPSIYFFDDLAPMHAACMTVDGVGYLLAGTGGAGKSAALLALGQNERVSFVCDDIAVMSVAIESRPMVHANLAWPKIYGYDCAGNDLETKLLQGRSWDDKTHYRIKNWIDPASVRRKIRPDRLYRKVEPVVASASRLYYVIRESVPDMGLSDLEVRNAVEMTIAVIGAEYSIFHDHLQWEKYNALATGRKAMLTMDEVVANWRAVLEKCLSSITCFKVGVPLWMDHATYRSRMIEMVMGGSAS